MLDSIPLFPGLPGGPELLIVLLIIVLLFGANKLPQLARSSGQAMGEFRRGREEIEEELKKGAEGESDDDDDEAEAEADEADATETEPENKQ
ncbi:MULTISPECIES: twin-arginine translocase TatA/TatE family subunit [Haloferax]|uniref:Sec-independent protein translocase protein TatA n=1 Tax=Haloferax massiliensis TaxID=1476858 RepID=A0A0D6JS68_9EURY|nr:MULTISPECIES: twin-arginine translocase TatA/TatE family subunit [Haloferax]MDS0240369.1 twin-arginine translocase TatA/TatE family subunit [Haloferax sp. S2CR25]MDS0443490.1 twin-arginine translocase TatA/TatE family subunit [Haloferax sp. S2CR25-2]CQR50488.1 Sec-independent protein translocase protein TatA [Haloferax massiliensis]